jgi:Amt family ammonium transporter
MRQNVCVNKKWGSKMIDTGDTAWVLTATALVLLMTMPGLALFYAGLVRSKNILSVLMHCSAICCAASVLWLVCGYSLAFDEGSGLIGGLGKAFFGVERDAVSGTIPESVFFSFQMTFAIITPALMVGAYVERIKFNAMLLFSMLWLLVVYAPVAHWVWGGGWLAEMGVMDFAGGIVVHITAGVSAVVVASVLGVRKGFPSQVEPPHAPWTGTIAGLATVTPASGFIGPLGGLILGLTGGVVCYIAVDIVKRTFRVDDSLDVLAVHGIGGATGTLLTAFLALPILGGIGLAEGVGAMDQLMIQFTGVGATVVYSVIATYILVKIVQATVGLRVDEDHEVEGLDYTAHGETGYKL